MTIGNQPCRAHILRASHTRAGRNETDQPRYPRSGESRAAPGGPIIAAALLLFTLTLQCLDVRAEMLFRSAERKNGRLHWSALKNYANSADTAYSRTPADGAPGTTEEVQVFLRGFITSEDVYGAKVMESLLKKGRQRISGNVVSFASNGGEVDAAMELGRLLRKLGVSTAVAAGDQCLSSCVFAFMGGDRRTVAGKIGIHRPYFTSTREVPDRRLHYRQLQKKLQEFMDELDFPMSFYEAVMAVPPESVNLLAPADLKRFYLEGMSPSTQDEVDAASARERGISVVEYLHQKAQAQPCVGTQDAVAPCEAAVAAARAAAPPSGRQSDESASGASGNVPGQPSANTGHATK